MKRKGFQIKAHPLTIIFGCVYILLGNALLTVIYILTVLFHEFVHYFVASYLGVPSDEMLLTPFGGCLKGEFLDIPKKQTLIITLSAPFVNLLTVLFVLALWWLFPNTYPYTESILFANLSVGLINLLPCYPLDGGRAIISIFPYEFVKKLVLIFSLILSLISLILFVLSVKNNMNLSYLMMSVFLFWGAVYDQKKDNLALKIMNKFGKNKGELLSVKGYIIDENTPDFKLINALSKEEYCLFFTVKKGKILKVITEEEFLKNVGK